MSRILITGATGFIGKSLSTHLESQGHTIFRLTRQPNLNSENTIIWDPEHGKLKTSQLEGFDIVIHLAGDPFTIGRWSEKKKEKIFTSRVNGTHLLSQKLAETDSRPKLFISTSAIGFYGNRGEELLDERSSEGKGLLPHICHEWERATHPLSSKGIRTVNARFGMVIGPESRGLKSMLPSYKLCLGGALGDGEQWVSWIDLSDLIEAIEKIFITESLHGPVNFVSPNPIRQKEFAKTLAGLLHRPAFMKMPAAIARLLFGVLADEMLLASTKVAPAKLTKAGFEFNYPKLADSLKKALGPM